MDNCNVVATEHSRYGLSCTCVETIECMSSAGSVYSVTYVVKFYYCWTRQICIVLYVEDCGESNAECCVLLVDVDRVMYIFREFLWCA